MVNYLKLLKSGLVLCQTLSHLVYSWFVNFVSFKFLFHRWKDAFFFIAVAYQCVAIAGLTTEIAYFIDNVFIHA